MLGLQGVGRRVFGAGVWSSGCWEWVFGAEGVWSGWLEQRVFGAVGSWNRLFGASGVWSELSGAGLFGAGCLEQVDWSSKWEWVFGGVWSGCLEQRVFGAVGAWNRLFLEQRVSGVGVWSGVFGAGCLERRVFRPVGVWSSRCLDQWVFGAWGQLGVSTVV